MSITLALSVAAALAPPPAAAAPRDTGLEAAMLEAHNRERARHGAAPLAWDPGLAAGAAAHARTLARLGRMAHAAQPDGAAPQGENLWMGTRGAFPPARMARWWSDEARHFLPGTFPAVSRTGNWADVAHFTQMIWPSTRQIGCAVASGGAHDFLVCRYRPAGNIFGEPVGTPADPPPSR